MQLSPLGKYVIKGKTRALGNGCALIVVIWEYNIPKVPELGQATLTLGEWMVTCHRAEREGLDYLYARVDPLDDNIDICEVQKDFQSFDGGEVVEITWIPPHNLPRSTTEKWLRLKVRGDPSHKGVHLPVGVLDTPLPSPSALLPWMPSDRPLPQHLQVSNMMLPLQWASPMSA